MTDLLAKQSEIRARRTPIRDKSGQFRRPDTIVQIQLAAERMKATLLRDVRTEEHARGVVWEDGHYRALPGAKLQVVESDIPHTGKIAGPDLFERAAA